MAPRRHRHARLLIFLFSDSEQPAPAESRGTTDARHRRRRWQHAIMPSDDALFSLSQLRAGTPRSLFTAYHAFQLTRCLRERACCLTASEPPQQRLMLRVTPTSSFCRPDSRAHAAER